MTELLVSRGRTASIERDSTGTWTIEVQHMGLRIRRRADGLWDWWDRHTIRALGWISAPGCSDSDEAIFQAGRSEALLGLRSSTPDDLRADGWTVAVHNDYRQDGQSYTFWLFTKNGRAVKGEGRTDAEALDEVRRIVKG